MIKGKFIVFEGLDGAGLTTQAELLKSWIIKQGRECYLTKEPSEGPAGAMIRLALAKRLVRPKEMQQYSTLDGTSLALFFAADRIDHLHSEILPRLRLGINVISDRYFLSSFAYQSLEVDLDWLKAINSKCEMPDLTIFINVPPEICKKRIERERWHIELYEDIQDLKKVHMNYINIIRQLSLEGANIEIVSGTDSIKNVHRSVLQAVKRLFLKSPAPILNRKQLTLQFKE